MNTFIEIIMELWFSNNHDMTTFAMQVETAVFFHIYSENQEG